LGSENETFEVEPLLRPLRRRLASLIDSSQNINADGVDSRMKSEVVCVHDWGAGLFREERYQISAYNWFVFGTSTAFLAEPDGEAKPEMRGRKMDDRPVLGLCGLREIIHLPRMRM
jgi:hypothetical protein